MQERRKRADNDNEHAYNIIVNIVTLPNQATNKDKKYSVCCYFF